MGPRALWSRVATRRRRPRIEPILLLAAVSASFLGVLELVGPATAMAGRSPPPPPPPYHEADEAGRQAFVIALALLVLPTVLAWYVSRHRARNRGTVQLATGFRRLLVGEDNRFSTSKTNAVIWTYLLAAGLLSVIIAKWMNHAGGFLATVKAGLDAQYGLLIGGPLGAAILAKGIVSSQAGNDPSSKPMSADAPALSQLITNDNKNVDLGDLQYVLFNAVAIVFFVGAIIQTSHAGLPHLPDILIELTSVSAVGFVGKKALPPAVSAQLISSATAGGRLTISGSGLLAGGQVQVQFGTIPAAVTAVASVNGVDTITVTVPPAPPGPTGPVDVAVITAGNARVNAGRFAWT